MRVLGQKAVKDSDTGIRTT